VAEVVEPPHLWRVVVLAGGRVAKPPELFRHGRALLAFGTPGKLAKQVEQPDQDVRIRGP
jgi:hypothetical protein